MSQMKLVEFVDQFSGPSLRLGFHGWALGKEGDAPGLSAPDHDESWDLD
jgi:hypothetical protein